MNMKTRAIIFLVALAPSVFAIFLFGFAVGLGWQVPEAWDPHEWIRASLIWLMVCGWMAFAPIDLDQ